MMHYVIIYCSFIYTFVLQNLWAIPLLLGLGALSLIFVINQLQNIYSKIVYQDLKITNWMIFMLITFILMIVYISFFSYRRFYFIGKHFDLKIFIYNIYLFIIHNDFVMLFSIIFCIINLLLLYLFL